MDVYVCEQTESGDTSGELPGIIPDTTDDDMEVVTLEDNKIDRIMVTASCASDTAILRPKRRISTRSVESRSEELPTMGDAMIETITTTTITTERKKSIVVMAPPDNLEGFSVVEHKKQRFLITALPQEDQLGKYVDKLVAASAYTTCRACACSYDTGLYSTKGMDYHVMPFADGCAPPKPVLEEWLELCRSNIQHNSQHHAEGAGTMRAIAVHCMAGLGRAPLLVAIALIEDGLPVTQAVAMVRKARHGALNSQQLRYLTEYQTKAAPSSWWSCGPLGSCWTTRCQPE